MKYSTIIDIKSTVTMFYEQIINPNALQKPRWEDVLKRCALYADETTQHGTDTIDVDFMKMCFTIYKDDNGYAYLCENASYYPDGFEKGNESEDIIDIELGEMR